MNPKHIACIVLASGLSNRFGPTEKLEAILCGKPVLVHVLETAASLDFGQLIQVCQPRKSVVSDLAGCRMPPAVFEKTALSKILESESGLGARAVFDAFALEHIPIPREQALDVDTSEDFDRVSAIMKTRLR